MIFRLIRASLRALLVLVSPVDRLKEPCPQGHPMHSGWNECPVCRLLAQQGARGAGPSQVALAIRDGRDDLRTFLLPAGTYQVGYEATADLVITPRELPIRRLERGVLEIGEGRVHLRMTSEGTRARVDGTEYSDLSLYDRDRVEMLGGEAELLLLRRGDS
jgi:hypothetical protein